MILVSCSRLLSPFPFRSICAAPSFSFLAGSSPRIDNWQTPEIPVTVDRARDLSHASSPAAPEAAAQVLRADSRGDAPLPGHGSQHAMARSQSQQIPVSHRQQAAASVTGKRQSFGPQRTPHRVENVNDLSPSEYTKQHLDDFDNPDVTSALSKALSADLASIGPQDIFGISGLSTSLRPDESTFANGAEMSRSATTESLCGGFGMISFDSTGSNLVSDLLNPYPSPDSVRTPSQVNPPPSASSFSPSQPGIETLQFPFTEPDSTSLSASAPSTFSLCPPPVSCGATDMRPSMSRESDTSSVSQSRAARRAQEQIVQGSRPIAPKTESPNSSPASVSPQRRMIRISSSDGRAKEVAAIPKASVQRPPRQKTYCDLCNDQPEGFHGEHELRRHKERVHAVVRKVWVCIDISPDKTFLANCKACRNGKRYGANYNAAAHLRRTHFNPRQRGRRGKESEKRGGKGGGNHPPMETLKHWMVQKEEILVDNSPETVAPDALGVDMVAPEDVYHRLTPDEDASQLGLETFLMNGYDLSAMALDPSFEKSLYFDSFDR